MRFFDPVLSNAQAAEFEAAYFARSSLSQADVISRVGRAIADSFYGEFPALAAPGDGSVPAVLAVLGSGHNAADALAFLAFLAQKAPLNISLLLPPPEALRPATAQMLEFLRSVRAVKIFHQIPHLPRARYDILLEGLSGMSYRPPMRPAMAERIGLLNAAPARIKISIDLPAGLSDAPLGGAPVFRPDITYAAAIAKSALFEISNRATVGRVRYIDVGFFDEYAPQSKKFAVRPSVLDALKKPRPSNTDKRSYGRLLVVSGSQTYAGAALLNAKAAIRAGAGFVYACAPMGCKPAFCAAEPSVIWLETSPDDTGAHALENFSDLNAAAQNADAILVGSGLTASREALALAAELLKANPNLPAVIDADAIRPEVLSALPARGAPAVITPHEGEFLRLAKDISDYSLAKCSQDYKCLIVLKSNITRICHGETIAYSPAGSPALARAGSGDILCALIAALIANKNLLASIAEDSDTQNETALKAAALACHWHGKAAEAAAARRTETALASSDLPDFLSTPLLK